MPEERSSRGARAWGAVRNLKEALRAQAPQPPHRYPRSEAENATGGAATMGCKGDAPATWGKRRTRGHRPSGASWGVQPVQNVATVGERVQYLAVREPVRLGEVLGPAGDLGQTGEGIGHAAELGGQHRLEGVVEERPADRQPPVGPGRSHRLRTLGRTEGGRVEESATVLCRL